MQSYTLEFELKELPPSLNRAYAMSWQKRKRIFDQIKLQSYLQIAGKRPSSPLNTYHITFTRHTIRPLDLDNLVASFKPVLDSLVLSRVILDDKWEMTDHVFYKQAKVAKKALQRITVQVKEINNL